MRAIRDRVASIEAKLDKRIGYGDFDNPLGEPKQGVTSRQIRGLITLLVEEGVI